MSRVLQTGHHWADFTSLSSYKQCFVYKEPINGIWVKITWWQFKCRSCCAVQGWWHVMNKLVKGRACCTRCLHHRGCYLILHHRNSLMLSLVLGTCIFPSGMPWNSLCCTDNGACFVSRNGCNRAGTACARKWVMRAIRNEWSTFLRYGFYWQWNRWSARRQK